MFYISAILCLTSYLKENLPSILELQKKSQCELCFYQTCDEIYDKLLEIIAKHPDGIISRPDLSHMTQDQLKKYTEEETFYTLLFDQHDLNTLQKHESPDNFDVTNLHETISEGTKANNPAVMDKSFALNISKQENSMPVDQDTKQEKGRRKSEKVFSLRDFLPKTLPHHCRTQQYRDVYRVMKELFIKLPNLKATKEFKKNTFSPVIGQIFKDYFYLFMEETKGIAYIKRGSDQIDKIDQVTKKAGYNNELVAISIFEVLLECHTKYTKKDLNNAKKETEDLKSSTLKEEEIKEIWDALKPLEQALMYLHLFYKENGLLWNANISDTELDETIKVLAEYPNDLKYAIYSSVAGVLRTNEKKKSL